ncbi:hypothetical protein [Actinomadura craniellae]|nr:hypothetical protein [Actinomadura craniellae]
MKKPPEDGAEEPRRFHEREEAARPGNASAGEGSRGPVEEDADRQKDADGEENDAREDEESALKALLGRAGAAERAEYAQLRSIVEHAFKSLEGDFAEVRIENFTFFNDSVNVGGEFTVGGRSPGGGGGGSAAGVLRLDGDQITAHTRYYVRPPRFTEGLESLREGRLLVLASRPGTGRDAAAVNLLVEALAANAADEDIACHLVADPAVLGEPGWKPPSRDSGYLVDLDGGPPDRAGPIASTIDERWIDTMAAAVRGTGGYMVVLTGEARGALVEVATRSSRVLTSLGDIDLVLVIARRVLGTDPGPEDMAELRRSLVESGAQDLLEEFPEPTMAVRLASVIETGGDLEVEVRELRDPAGQVHGWFSRHRGAEAISFALAAAVLEDSGYLTVSDAAVGLYKMLTPESDHPPDLRFRDRLGSDHSWLELAQHPRDGANRVSTGLPQVRFRNRHVRQAVLGYAWTYLDGARSVILRWIRGLLVHRDVQVRARAAVAAGIIAWSDHDHALQRYLRPWAGDSSRPVREGAGTALEIVASRPELAEPVWDVVEAWSAEEGSAFQRRLSLTAASVAGGPLGARRPGRALEVLRTVLDNDWDGLVSVGLSVLRLVELGQVPEVLTALLEWSEPQDSSPLVTKALSVFLFVASAPPPGGEEGPDAVSPPLVHAREHRPLTAELWARALARKPAQIQALEVLREYLDVYADRDPASLHEIRAILLEIAARPGRHRRRLEWYLDEWARDGSRSAAAIRAALARPVMSSAP